eukprot:10842041-Heterocapsa_arctica.AAC.1
MRLGSTWKHMLRDLSASEAVDSHSELVASFADTLKLFAAQVAPASPLLLEAARDDVAGMIA